MQKLIIMECGPPCLLTLVHATSLQHRLVYATAQLTMIAVISLLIHQLKPVSNLVVAQNLIIGQHWIETGMELLASPCLNP